MDYSLHGYRINQNTVYGAKFNLRRMID